MRGAARLRCRCMHARTHAHTKQCTDSTQCVQNLASSKAHSHVAPYLYGAYNTVSTRWRLPLNKDGNVCRAVGLGTDVRSGRTGSSGAEGLGLLCRCHSGTLGSAAPFAPIDEVLVVARPAAVSSSSLHTTPRVTTAHLRAQECIGSQDHTSNSSRWVACAACAASHGL